MNEEQMEAMRALIKAWRTPSNVPCFSEVTASFFSGQDSGFESAADDLEAMLSGDLFTDTRAHKVVYQRPGESAPYQTKPLALVDAEALAVQYRSQGLDVVLVPVD